MSKAKSSAVSWVIILVLGAAALGGVLYWRHSVNSDLEQSDKDLAGIPKVPDGLKPISDEEAARGPKAKLR